MKFLYYLVNYISWQMKYFSWKSIFVSNILTRKKRVFEFDGFIRGKSEVVRRETCLAIQQAADVGYFFKAALIILSKTIMSRKLLPGQ